MKIIDPTFQIEHLPPVGQAEELIERAGRTCYKSEHRIGPGSAGHLIHRVIQSGHGSVLEHSMVSIRIVCDRGVSHELVRHRMASFSQESTRYANYSGERFGRETTVIRPFFWAEDSLQYCRWKSACQMAEDAYLNMLDDGASPQEARSVLPNSLKTEIVITANIREWRHIFALRCDMAAHPQMRQIMVPLYRRLAEWSPILFADIQAWKTNMGATWAKEMKDENI